MTSTDTGYRLLGQSVLRDNAQKCGEKYVGLLFETRCRQRRDVRRGWSIITLCGIYVRR